MYQPLLSSVPPLWCHADMCVETNQYRVRFTFSGRRCAARWGWTSHHVRVRVLAAYLRSGRILKKSPMWLLITGPIFIHSSRQENVIGCCFRLHFPQFWVSWISNVHDPSLSLSLSLSAQQPSEPAWRAAGWRVVQAGAGMWSLFQLNFWIFSSTQLLYYSATYLLKMILWILVSHRP